MDVSNETRKEMKDRRGTTTGAPNQRTKGHDILDQEHQK